ncbi:hypothetical protein [Brachybacterium epidermidis]|uniref:hypothetical protein n=1 Tax=Brachybacterium epidermidis TaxID=2781983 RepID=UPI00398F75F1
MSAPGSGGYGPQQPYDQTHQRGTPPQHYGHAPEYGRAPGDVHPQQGPAPGDYGAPGYGQAPPPKKPWALITVASGCILALLLGIGGGITYLALSDGGEQTAGPTATPEPETTTPSPATETLATEAPAAEAPTYRIISPIDEVEGSADDVWAILAASPLTEGTMEATGTCELPATPVDHDAEQLQALLDAAGACLNRVWATASSDRNLPWIPPRIQVYTWPDIPESPCEPDTFEQTSPRQCNLDGVLYWPLGAGYGAQQEDPAKVPTMYLWDLSLNYLNGITWNTGMWPYYRALDAKLEDDPDRQAEANRRYWLQHLCLASAVSMRVPEASQPSQQVRDTLTSVEHWTPADASTSTIAPESRGHWVRQGFEAGGDLTRCNTWLVPAEQVA